MMWRVLATFLLPVALLSLRQSKCCGTTTPGERIQSMKRLFREDLFETYKQYKLHLFVLFLILPYFLAPFMMLAYFHNLRVQN